MPASGARIGFSPFCFGELSRDTPVKRGVCRLLVLVQVERRHFQREKNVAEVQLGYATNSVRGVIHAAPVEPRSHLSGIWCLP